VQRGIELGGIDQLDTGGLEQLQESGLSGQGFLLAKDLL
jgi:hypothetical protein